ncbi:MAG TPA: IS110 family transposase [Casimicrobiaceae bacterium]|jgi:transposase|nr:IS110 family transposase [Casimicrobiaceae bacterium]
MDKITAVGLDLAKQIIQVHAIGATGRVVLRKVVRRERLLALLAQFPRCVVGMEACSGAHHWARELSQLGHDTRIMAAEFVRPFRKSLAAKNDANDAEAVCTAMLQPNMRFVTRKSVEQQALLCLHRVRQGLIEERTASINRLRGLLAEFGQVAPQSAPALQRALSVLLVADTRLPGLVHRCMGDLREHVRAVEGRIAALDREIAQHAQGSESARRIAALCGVGPNTASAVVATVGDAREYRNGRQFAAWLGLVPKQYSSAGKTKLGRITKRGDAYLRMLLIQGARSALQAALRRTPAKRDRLSAWIVQLAQRVGYHKTLVAIANKHARVIWALLARGETFDRARGGAH